MSFEVGGRDSLPGGDCCWWRSPKEPLHRPRHCCTWTVPMYRASPWRWLCINLVDCLLRCVGISRWVAIPWCSGALLTSRWFPPGVTTSTGISYLWQHSHSSDSSCAVFYSNVWLCPVRKRKGCKAEFQLPTANHTFHSQQPLLQLSGLVMVPAAGSGDNMESLCQEMLLIEQGLQFTAQVCRWPWSTQIQNPGFFSFWGLHWGLRLLKLKLPSCERTNEMTGTSLIWRWPQWPRIFFLLPFLGLPWKALSFPSKESFHLV